LKIVVAEDLPDTAQMFSVLLKLEGHSVRIADDGEEAFNLVSLTKPDALILDIGLPKLSGYEVCTRIRAQPWGRRIAIVAVSGFGEAEYVEAALQAGVDAYIAKPPDPVQLLAALAEAVGRRKAL
jgi:CheY-like chemotaxis protein